MVETSGLCSLVMSPVPLSPSLSLRPKEKLGESWTIRACVFHHLSPAWFSHNGSPCYFILWSVAWEDGGATWESCMAWGNVRGPSPPRPVHNQHLSDLPHRQLQPRDSFRYVSPLDQHHLLPPTPTLSLLLTFATYGDFLSWLKARPPREGAMVRARGLARPSGLLPLVQHVTTHPILCFYVLCPSMGPTAFIYLWGVLWKSHSHGLWVCWA